MEAKSNREELRKKRELEEARKSGLIPAEKDEEGRDINPHIPQYIARAPWYLNNEQPSLKHQRREGHETSTLAKWYTRGVKEDQLPQKKYKKGSCENCGATTHKAVDCVERPRARGAKWTNSEIAPDEYIPTEDLSQFEAKRDRWGGYDPDAFGLVVEEYVAAEEEATKRRVDQELAAAAQTEGVSGGVDDTDSSSESEDGGGAKIKDFDVSNAPVGTKDDRTRTTTRNLRIREDTAKYLINLDLDSAFYDPKTRSMRGDPTLGLDPSIQEKIPYRGDNAVRLTGEADIVNQYEAFAWEARKHGQVIHKQANPTQIELAYQEHEKRKKTLVTQRQKELLERYGGAQHLEPLPE